jgi:ABC-type dipeptide/oligopeptide/nickel transport system permease component
MIRRLFSSAVVIILVSGFTFIISNYTGDPVLTIVGKYGLTKANRQRIVEKYGFDKPVFIQYSKFLLRAIHGDLGTSFVWRRPVIEVIARRIPASVELLIAALFIALTFGIGPGVILSGKPRSVPSKLAFVLSLVGLSIPTFVSGILFLTIFCVVLKWLPAFGRGGTIKLGFWPTGFLTISGLKHLIMPAITLSLYQVAFMFRLTHSEMMEQLGRQYIQTARSKGIYEWKVLFKHAFKNASKPLVVVIGLSVGIFLGFSIVTEAIFQWPGLGNLLMSSIAANDRPVIVAYLMFISMVVVFSNFGADIILGFVDPRIRYD